jgi:hypothetical protein
VQISVKTSRPRYNVRKGEHVAYIAWSCLNPEGVHAREDVVTLEVSSDSTTDNVKASSENRLKTVVLSDYNIQKRIDFPPRSLSSRGDSNLRVDHKTITLVVESPFMNAVL